MRFWKLLQSFFRFWSVNVERILRFGSNVRNRSPFLSVLIWGWSLKNAQKLSESLIQPRKLDVMHKQNGYYKFGHQNISNYSITVWKVIFFTLWPYWLFWNFEIGYELGKRRVYYVRGFKRDHVMRRKRKIYCSEIFWNQSNQQIY